MIKYTCDICDAEVGPAEAWGVGVFPSGKPRTFTYKGMELSVSFSKPDTHDQFCGKCTWEAILWFVKTMAPSGTTVEWDDELNVDSHMLPDPELLGNLVDSVLGGAAASVIFQPLDTTSDTEDSNSTNNAVSEEPSDNETGDKDNG